MDNQDRKRFAEMWAGTRVEIYDKPVTAEGIEMVFRALSRFTIEQVEHGITLHLNDTQNGQFPITPTHVVAQIEGRADERSGAAWSKLYKAIGSVGGYSDVVFDDPIIHSVVENEGGWQHICLMTEDDCKYMQARFMKQYAALVSKSGQFKFPKVLAGSINLSRKANNLELDPPQTVGDIKLCRAVYRGGESKSLEINHHKTLAEFAGSGLKGLQDQTMQ